MANASGPLASAGKTQTFVKQSSMQVGSNNGGASSLLNGTNTNGATGGVVSQTHLNRLNSGNSKRPSVIV